MLAKVIFKHASLAGPCRFKSGVGAVGDPVAELISIDSDHGIL